MSCGADAHRYDPDALPGRATSLATTTRSTSGSRRRAAGRSYVSLCLSPGDSAHIAHESRRRGGAQLTQLKSGEVVARFTQELVKEGFFCGERKWCLQIEPTALDIDTIVLTFIIMEKRWRDRVAAEGMKEKGRGDDDVPEGGCEGTMGG